RHARRWDVAKEEPDRRLHAFGLPAGLHVKLDDEVGARIETPGHFFGQQRRDLPRSPAKKVPVGVLRRSRDQAFVAWRRVGFIELPGGGRVIDSDVGVMNDLGVARTELQSADELGGLNRYG